MSKLKWKEIILVGNINFNINFEFHKKEYSYLSIFYDPTHFSHLRQIYVYVIYSVINTNSP